MTIAASAARNIRRSDIRQSTKRNITILTFFHLNAGTPHIFFKAKQSMNSLHCVITPITDIAW